MSSCDSSAASPSQSKDLKYLFNPKSVAVVGASPNPQKIGYQILSNIVEGGFSGDIFPVNPKENKILGCKAYKSVLDIPQDVEFVVISVPAPFVIPVMEECAKKGIKSAAVITSGFGEVGNIEDEKRIKEIADQANMSVIGPNILGMVYSPSNLNASFGPRDILPGKIAFISQSGALAISLMGWTVMEKIGLASLVSIGNKVDIEEKELIEYFNDDENINVILIYMEGLKDGKKFLNTKIKKPVIALKVGCSQRGAKAAASHTGSLSGSDKIYDAAFGQVGILRARTFAQAFGWARAFSLPAPEEEGTLIITNGGGIGVFATDECEAMGIKLLDDPEWLEGKFRKTMPDFGSTKNPVDITGGGHSEQYREATRIALQENKVKAVIILYCETAVTKPLEIAQAIEAEYQNVNRNKPLVVAMVGGERSRDALLYLNGNNIPAFNDVNEATSALKVLYTWKDTLARQKDNPRDNIPPKEAVDFIENIKKENRSILLEHEARKVMELCGVPTPRWGFASSVDEAMKEAKGMYPLAMKIASVDIIHKTDIGGVVLNIGDENELKGQYEEMMNKVKKAAPKANILGVNLIQMISGIECIVGMSHDPQFGPVVMFGLGGVFVEALKDVTFRVVPFGDVEANRMLTEIKAKKILEGFRGIAAHKESIVQTLCAIQKLSMLVKEIDINPLITNQQGSFAVDARVVL